MWRTPQLCRRLDLWSRNEVKPLRLLSCLLSMRLLQVRRPKTRMDQATTRLSLTLRRLDYLLTSPTHLHRTDYSGSLLRCSRHSERTGLSYATSMHAWRQPKKQRQLGRRDQHLPGRREVCLVRLERLVAHGVPVVACLVVRRRSESHRMQRHQSSQLAYPVDLLHDSWPSRVSQPRRRLVDRRVRLEHRLPCRRTIRAMVQYKPTARS